MQPAHAISISGETSTDADGALVSAHIPTPLGPMLGVAGDSGLLLLEFADGPALDVHLKRAHKILGRPIAFGVHPILAQTERELAEFFVGTRSVFSIPIVLGGTPFQRKVWTALLAIPMGSTRSYDKLARDIDLPGGQRAVGRANGDNRLAILVPCHRVVRADGSLCGYGGGVWRKKHLLALESRHAPLSFGITAER